MILFFLFTYFQHSEKLENGLAINPQDLKDLEKIKSLHYLTPCSTAYEVLTYQLDCAQITHTERVLLHRL